MKDKTEIQVSSEQRAGIEGIRFALSSFDFLSIQADPERTEVESVPDIDAFSREVTDTWDLAQAARYEEILHRLPILLSKGEVLVRSVHGEVRSEAFALLSQIYQVVAAVMAKMREAELAWLASDRSVMAADRSGRPLLALAGVYRLGRAFVIEGWKLEQAERGAASAALAVSAQFPGEGFTGASPESVSLYGSLNLVRAIAAARLGNADSGWQAIAEAERAAAYLGEDRNDFRTHFGPTNVTMHAVAVAVELGDGAEALRRAVSVPSGCLSNERQARYLIDLARAYALQGDASSASAVIREASRLAPQEVRQSPYVGEILSADDLAALSAAKFVN
ncbi:MAG TPA: hypothetical protein VGZ00_04935 [Candidatus Baltobacteraceae bacterium]|jgi:hypothetical protein|nr:hypothetical protein [Candidatus Baltobacteraceae bacterium]